MSLVATQSHSITFEEAALLDPATHPGELDEGRWVPMSRGTWRHGEICLNLAMILGRFCREHPEWRAAVNDPGVKLGRFPDTLRGPDIAVIRAERRPTGEGVDGWLEGAPELVVEVAGGSQSPGELASKALQYLSAGAKAVWIVDGKARVVMIFTAPNVIRVVNAVEGVGLEAGSGTLDGGDALPGFSCELADIFR